MAKKGDDKPKFTIKSMNQKIRRVAERFGVESLPYKRLIADIDRDFRGMTHYTSKGVIQVTQSKNTKLNTYQTLSINRISRRAGVKQITKKSKERLKKQGITKPTAAQITQEVKEFTRMQEEFDKALDLVYEHEIAGDLPRDIRQRYEKIYRHGAGAGMGVSKEDVQYIETKIFEFDDLRNRLNDISANVYRTAREQGVRVSDTAKIAIENCIQGEYTTDEVARVIERLNTYLERLQIDPENAEFESI